MPSKRDKTTGLPIPNPVVPETSICLTILVPNALEYRTALKGALSELGKSWNWAQTVGEDNTAAYQAAELWRERLAQAVYQLDCGGGEMSCQDVADCIETSPEVQTALSTSDAVSTNVFNTINNSEIIQQTIYQQASKGVPMLPAQRDTVVTGSDGCSNDALFGSIGEIVSQLDVNNRDFLEFIEVGTNSRERVTLLIEAIPIVGEFVPAEIVDMIDKLQSEILENYEAQWTTALRDTYKCDIFCLAQEQDDCEVTFQMLVEYFNNRLGTQLEPINFFSSVVQYFLLGTWSGSTVVDIMMLLQLSAWQEASNWMGISLRTLQTVGLVGANNPDPDWTLICEDCTDGPCQNYLNLLTSSHGFTPLSGNSAAYGSWVLNEGLKAGATQFAFNTTFPVTGPYYIRLIWNQMPGGTAINWRQQNGTYNGPGTFPGPVLVDGKWTTTFNKNVPISTSIYMGITGTTGNPDLRIIGICYQTEPF